MSLTLPEPVGPDAGATTTTTNPLLASWPGPFDGVPPFDAGTPDRFRDALERGIVSAQDDIRRIVDDPSPPDFENTIAALERSGRLLDRVARMAGVMTGSMSDAGYKALERDMAPKLAAARDTHTFNVALFRRIAAVFEQRHDVGLSSEQLRLVERTYRQFVRAGAALDHDQKAQLGAINQELAGLFTGFAQRVLADENTWTVLNDEADLAGLSASFRSGARAAAIARGNPNAWAVVNTRSSVDPFLATADRRDLRERVWRKFVGRGDNRDENDTNTIVARIVLLRAERARLLGYQSHAHWRMAESMAQDPQRARDLLDAVWAPAVARVAEEVADMQDLADKDGGGFRIEPWDYRYYAEKMREQRYSISEAEVKPYFELDQMIRAAFWCAERLYGLQFSEISGSVPVFHPDVRVWEVTDQATGAHRGVFYGDYYARPDKRSGAWASSYRSRQTFDGDVRPISSNNNNFVRAGDDEPTLISLDDARVLFHEFGHALHSLLSEVRYPGLGATPRDYVEFPSQVNEHWFLTRPVLDRFARHHQTGAAMPQELVDKIHAANKFNQGFATVEYLSAAILDLELHTRTDGQVDPAAFERETLDRIGMPAQLVMRHRTPHFNHLFSGDAYSAGYYSYLWSEVMDADTWDAFVQAGDPFDPVLAAGMRALILAPGDSSDRGEAYRKFRGRDPQVDALLRQRGFPTP
jgi:peptidyl-dipeptidase Dcp